MIVAVFLSYNANNGLPFVPTYDLTVQVPDAAGLVRGNEVRIGGKRVGVIEDIRAKTTGDGTDPLSELDVALLTTLDPLPADSRVTVRPRHLSMDFLEKSHLPSCSTAGMRRSIAIWVTTFSSIASYREASFTSMVSLGSTSIDPLVGRAQ